MAVGIFPMKRDWLTSGRFSATYILHAIISFFPNAIKHYEFENDARQCWHDPILALADSEK